MSEAPQLNSDFYKTNVNSTFDVKGLENDQDMNEINEDYDDGEMKKHAL